MDDRKSVFDPSEKLNGEFKEVSEFFEKKSEEDIYAISESELSLRIMQVMVHYMQELLKKHNMLAAKDRRLFDDIGFCMDVIEKKIGRANDDDESSMSDECE